MADFGRYSDLPDEHPQKAKLSTDMLYYSLRLFTESLKEPTLAAVKAAARP